VVLDPPRAVGAALELKHSLNVTDYFCAWSREQPPIPLPWVSAAALASGCLRTGPDQARPLAARPRRATVSMTTATSSTAAVIMNRVDAESCSSSMPLSIEPITRAPASAE
jgi:hypothetical protein